MKKYRIDSGLQIKDFAQIIGVSSDTIINWENDRAKPMPEDLTNLEQILEKCDCNNLSALH
ncbi:helix-turn-helix domain-containing protein [Candidatus Latescibacterota bacterium]